jgi:hypothetical protein
MDISALTNVPAFIILHNFLTANMVDLYQELFQN